MLKNNLPRHFEGARNAASDEPSLSKPSESGEWGGLRGGEPLPEAGVAEQQVAHLREEILASGLAGERPIHA